MLKIYVKVFETLKVFLNPQMGLVYILYYCRCWYKILLSTIHTPAHDLKVKLTDLEIYAKVYIKVFKIDKQAQVQASCPV